MPPARAKLIVGILSCLVLLVPGIVSAQDTEHVVQRGETLYRISQYYGVSIDVIAQANNISNVARIDPGQQLIIPDLTDAVDTPLFAGEPEHYVVRRGETLASIAARYGLTVNQLARLNNITDPNRINSGQTLTIFTVPDSEAASDEAAAAPAPTPAPTTYVVQPGETLADIAQRLDISWTSLVQANNITNPNHIEVGQILTIPDEADLSNLGFVTPSYPVPEPTITVGKEIIVDLSESRVYAYENGHLVHSTLGSTGLPGSPTVKGDFTVQRKYESQTMSGPGYYLPGVQWIMYFYAGYALHGTYWHSNWGHPMSHGCVNLPNDEALWYYNWAPIGTPVHVQA